MLQSNKESGDYLMQIKNNTSEKTGIIGQSLENQRLPKTENGATRIIELGTGGGESLRRLKETSAKINGAEVIAVDIIPNLAATLKKEIGVEAVAADAGNLPFIDEQISAINASAIFHEISSYGARDNGGKLLYGTEAIQRSFKELNRVLLPEGIVAYRDILAPPENLQEQKTVEYNRESWLLFAEWFLKDFISSQPEFYKQATIQIKKIKNGFSLKAPIGLQRELQRHYLMFRDYLRTVKQDEFGITMLRSDWLNEKEGLKTVTFSVNGRVASMADLSAFEMHNSANGKVYRGDSDKFDKIYDDLMEYYFHNLNNGDQDASDFKNIINDWKEREGHEHYLYGNITDLLKLSIDVSGQTHNPYILFPESAEDIKIEPRYYYNRYLNQAVGSPEKDGKQIVAFKKLPSSNILKSLQAIEDSSLNGDTLNTDSLKKLREEAEKK